MSEQQKYINDLKAEITKCEQPTYTPAYSPRTYLAFGVSRVEECGGGYMDDTRVYYTFVGEFTNHTQAFEACKTDNDKNARQAKIFESYSSADKERIMRSMGHYS